MLLRVSGPTASQLLNPSANNLLQKRFQNDMSINKSSVEVLQDQLWVPIPWWKLQVGDIIKVYFSNRSNELLCDQTRFS